MARHCSNPDCKLCKERGMSRIKDEHICITCKHFWKNIWSPTMLYWQRDVCKETVWNTDCETRKCTTGRHEEFEFWRKEYAA